MPGPFLLSDLSAASTGARFQFFPMKRDAKKTSEQVMPLSSNVDKRVNAIPEEGRSASHRDLFFTVLIMDLTWTLHMIQKAKRQYSDRLTRRIKGGKNTVLSLLACQTKPSTCHQTLVAGFPTVSRRPQAGMSHRESPEETG
jgi:hypothetical protein